MIQNLASDSQSRCQRCRLAAHGGSNSSCLPVSMTGVKSEPFPSNPHQIRFRPADYSPAVSPAAPGRRNSSNSCRARFLSRGHQAPWRPPRGLWRRSSTGLRLCPPPRQLFGEPLPSAVTRPVPARALVLTSAADLVLLGCRNVLCFDCLVGVVRE